MAVTTTPLGFQKPDGNELARNGDNVIAANAQKAEDRHQEDRGRLASIEAKNVTQDTRLTNVESKNATQDGRLTSAETAATTISGRVTATEAKNATQDSRLTAAEAKNVAQDATLNNHKSRVESLETLGGLAPGDVSDATVADLIANPSTGTSDELALRLRNPYPGRLVVNTSDAAITASLQARLDALNANGGGTLEIPDAGGELTLTTTLLHGGDTRIVGQSKGTKLGAVGNFPLFASRSPGARIDNVEISNLELRRYGSGSTTPLIDWTGVSHSNMRDTKIEQGTARATSIGVLLGLDSYYNNFTGVQVRQTATAFRMQDAANGNRFNGGTLALYCNDGYVVDNSNANSFLGASAELLTGVGFDFLNGSKMNQVIGCRIENMAIGARVQYSGNPAFNNYLAANAFYMGAGQVEYDVQTDNVVIDRRMGYVFKNLYAADQRTFVAAWKSTAQASLPIATWTKVLYQNWDADHLTELSGSTFTAKTAGVYTVTGAALFPTAAAGNVIELAVYKNGAYWLTLDRRTSAGTDPTQLGGTRTMPLALGDTVEIYAKASANVGITSGRNGTVFQVSRHG